MDNQEAKKRLSAARPDGADANDPLVSEALERARRDPELASWLSEERAFDMAVVRKLQSKEPPADLRARLVAGARPNTRTKERRGLPVAWWMGLAAAVVLVIFGAARWHLRPVSPDSEYVGRPPLLEWQQSCLAIFDDPNFALDLMHAEYPPLEQHLTDHGTRVLPAIPFAPGAVGLVGCKVLAWRDQPVSFLCFKAETGELVHLFVVPRGTADETLIGARAHRALVGEFATVTWIQGDLVAFVASKMPAERLETMLAHDIAAAPTRWLPSLGEFAVDSSALGSHRVPNCESQRQPRHIQPNRRIVLM
ncbi:hypothetical protein ASA1KI_41380 [Opitutales bacterium ASA1]|uniref:hypothetical protein n=1 Tax=Congregicoccus parvus TaxID=3081749 RepID=UPI002B2F42CA|nr:hypothetical protein ASA1KI_41380 [Opitutales bacterium ASA1]